MPATPEETLAEEGRRSTKGVPAPPEETLAEEERRSTKAGAAAIAAGLLTLVGAVLAILGNSGFPRLYLLDTLRSELGLVPGSGPGPIARVALFLEENIALIVGARLVTAVALGLMGLTMVYLYKSTKARNPEQNKVALIASISGAVLAVIAGVAAAIGLAQDVSAFADAARQNEELARDALAGSFTTGAVQLSGLGSAILGLGIALTALNAMRVGLLTRFMGILGVIVGVLSFLPQLEGQLPFVKIFWFVALGALFLGRWPGGRPPAWESGQAQPWPTQQELREARMEARGESPAKADEPEERRPRRGRAEPPETPAPELPRAKPHSSSKKKKRKRR
ncbi:MAG TPA: hypothetical protein VGR11_06980 [Solirubrobacteraceae bacterium]|nr:hypothetical protein [Solirubrobacteraceae bacterium]